MLFVPKAKKIGKKSVSKYKLHFHNDADVGIFNANRVIIPGPFGPFGLTLSNTDILVPPSTLQYHLQWPMVYVYSFYFFVGYLIYSMNQRIAKRII